MDSAQAINRAMDQLLKGEISPADYVAIVRRANEDLAAYEREHLHVYEQAHVLSA